MAKEPINFPLTEEEVNLITFALRRCKQQTSFMSIEDDCAKLIKKIETISYEKQQSRD
jgi:hypothetical protein